MVNLTPALEAWLTSRPESVRQLAAEFPCGLQLRWEDETWYLVGYNESDQLIFSAVHPLEWHCEHLPDEHRRVICASHVREHRKTH